MVDVRGSGPFLWSLKVSECYETELHSHNLHSLPCFGCQQVESVASILNLLKNISFFSE